MLGEQSVSALVIFADLFDIPKIAVAERISGPLIRHITLPGGKNEGVTQVQTLRDEIQQETGVFIPQDAKIRRVGRPIRFTSAAQSISLSLFFTEIGKSIPHEYMLPEFPTFRTTKLIG